MGLGEVELPFALANKYTNAAREWKITSPAIRK
jgi:hypothetical protein